MDKQDKNKKQNYYNLSKNQILVYPLYRNSIAIERIVDFSLSTLQKNELVASIFNQEKIKNIIKDKVEADFREKNLIITKDISPQEKKLIEKKQSLLIRKYIKNEIKKIGQISVTIPFEKFLFLIGFSAKENSIDYNKIKFTHIINLITNLQEKSKVQMIEEVISDDCKEIYTDFYQTYRIPTIKIRVKQNEKENINTIEDLIKSTKRKKLSYIKEIELVFMPEILMSFGIVEKQYIALNIKKRLQYKNVYSFKLESIIRLIENKQFLKSENYFTLKKLNMLFGVKHKEMRFFVNTIIKPSLEEINTFFKDEFFVTYKVKKDETNKQHYLIFNIERYAKFDKILIHNMAALPYYIASRFYFSIDINKRKSKIKDFYDFANMINKKIDNMKDEEILYLYDEEYKNKTIKVWKEELRKNLIAQNKVLDFIENNKEKMKEKNIFYDDWLMCIVRDNIEENIEKKKPNIFLLEKMIDNPAVSLEYIKLM